MRHMPCRN